MTYLPALVYFPSLSAKFISLLCITSLLATAYILFIPNTQPVSSRSKQGTPQTASETSPLHRYLDKLNGGLSFILALNAVTTWSKSEVHEGFWILCILPARKLPYTALGQRPRVNFRWQWCLV